MRAMMIRVLRTASCRGLGWRRLPCRAIPCSLLLIGVVLSGVESSPAMARSGSATRAAAPYLVVLFNGFEALAEGVPFSGQLATFTTTNQVMTASNFSASISWGDGTAPDGSATITGGNGSFQITDSHTWIQAGTYTVMLQVNGTDGSTGGATSAPLKVADQPLTATAGAEFIGTIGTTLSGVVATFKDANPAATVASFTAMIGWGDTTAADRGTVTADANGGFAVSGQHVYTAAGSFFITVHIVDIGGSAADALLSASISGTPFPILSPTGPASGQATPTAAAPTPIPQLIQFGPIPDHRFGDAPFTVSAVGGASGNPVSFVTSGPCTASGSNGSMIALVGVGTCTVTASQAGTGGYAAATPVSRPFSIARGVPVVTWPAPATIKYGTRLGGAQLDATAQIAGTFTYKPAPGTALPARANQALVVTFTPTDSVNWESVVATTTITVERATQHIAFVRLQSHVYGDAPFKLSVTGDLAGTTTQYSAKGPCKLTGSLLTLTGAGTCTLAASQPGSANYLGASARAVTILIAKARPTIAWAAPKTMTAGARLGKEQLDATATFQQHPLLGTYVYSPPGGTRLATGRHALTVTFKPLDGKDFDQVMARVLVTVR